MTVSQVSCRLVKIRSNARPSLAFADFSFDAARQPGLVRLSIDIRSPSF